VVVLEPVANLGRTYGVRQPVGGPRLRLGTLWFLVLLVALAIGAGAVALVFAVVAAVAALQVAGAWKARKVTVNQIVAAAGAGLLPLGAWWGNRGAGFVLLLSVVVAVVLGADTRLEPKELDAERLRANLPVVAATLRSGLFVGIAGAAAVQVHRVDAMSFLYLVSVVCVYDSGDYLIGSGYRQRWVGPLAGIIGIVVVIAAMSAINPPPLTDDGDVWVLGLLMAVACPLGQMLGSWVLPSTRAKAPALRRLDAWLVTAPLFLVCLWIVR
jgi:hypothetical protein